MPPSLARRATLLAAPMKAIPVGVDSAWVLSVYSSWQAEGRLLSPNLLHRLNGHHLTSMLPLALAPFLYRHKTCVRFPWFSWFLLSKTPVNDLWHSQNCSTFIDTGLSPSPHGMRQG